MRNNTIVESYDLNGKHPYQRMIEILNDLSQLILYDKQIIKKYCGELIICNELNDGSPEYIPESSNQLAKIIIRTIKNN